MRFSVLGPVSIATADGLVALGAPRQAGLLAALLLQNGQSTRTEVLADLLWDGEPVTDAALRVTLGRLRKRLKGSGIDDPFRRARGVIGLDLQPDDVDVWHFEALVARARRLRSMGRLRPAVREFEDALALFRGRPYEDLLDIGAIATESDRLMQLGRSLELELMVTLIECGEPLSAAERAQHPRVSFDEDVVADEQRVCLAAIGLGRSQRWSQAVELLTDFMATLREGWALEPGPTLSSIAAAAAAALEAPDLVVAREFGGEVLARFAPLDSAATSGSPTTGGPSPGADLPMAPGASRLLRRHRQGPLVGRFEESLRLVRHLERRSEAPVLFISGDAGSGRSHLLASAAAVGAERGLLMVALAIDESSRSTVDRIADELEHLGIRVEDSPPESEPVLDVAAAVDQQARRVGAVGAALADVEVPLLVIVDDLVRCDEASVEALLSLVRRCPEVVWVMAAEVEPVADAARLASELLRTGEAEVQPLAPLDAEAVSQLIALSAPELASDELVAQIQAASHGSVASMIGQIQYVAAVGAWDGDDAAVERFVRQRVAALEDQERALLQAFAVTDGSGRLAAAASAAVALLGRDPWLDGSAEAVAEHLVDQRLLVDGDGPRSFGVAGTVVAEAAMSTLRRSEIATLRLALAEALARSGDCVAQANQLVALGSGWWDEALMGDAVVRDALSELLGRSAHRSASELGAAYVDTAGVDRPGMDALGARVLAATAMVATGDGGGAALAKMARSQARAAGDPGLVADAATALAPTSSGRPLPLAEIDELVGELDHDPLRQVTLACWVAHQLSLAGRDRESLELIETAETGSATLGSSRLRGLATGIRYQACTGVTVPPQASDRALADLTSLVELTDDASARTVWALSSISAAVRDGDPADVQEGIDRLDRAIELSPRPDLPWIRACVDVASALMRADLEAAQAAVGPASEIGRAHGMHIAEGLSGMYGALISWESANLGVLRDFFPTSASADGPGLVAAALRVAADAETEQWPDAELVLQSILEVDDPLVVAGQMWPLVCALVGEAGFELRHEPSAVMIADGLQVHRGRGLGVYAFASYGAADRLAGMAAAVRGQLDLAALLLESALASELARGLVSWAGRSQVALASVLTLRGGPDDLRRAEELWQLEAATPGVAAFMKREQQRLALA